MSLVELERCRWLGNLIGGIKMIIKIVLLLLILSISVFSRERRTYSELIVSDYHDVVFDIDNINDLNPKIIRTDMQGFKLTFQAKDRNYLINWFEEQEPRLEYHYLSSIKVQVRYMWELDASSNWNTILYNENNGEEPELNDTLYHQHTIGNINIPYSSIAGEESYLGRNKFFQIKVIYNIYGMTNTPKEDNSIYSSNKNNELSVMDSRDEPFNFEYSEIKEFDYYLLPEADKLFTDNNASNVDELVNSNIIFKYDKTGIGYEFSSPILLSEGVDTKGNTFPGFYLNLAPTLFDKIKSEGHDIYFINYAEPNTTMATSLNELSDTLGVSYHIPDIFNEFGNYGSILAISFMF